MVGGKYILHLHLLTLVYIIMITYNYTYIHIYIYIYVYVMSCHECYIRFIITEHEGHRPEGEVIISLILHGWA